VQKKAKEALVSDKMVIFRIPAKENRSHQYGKNVDIFLVSREARFEAQFNCI